MSKVSITLDQTFLSHTSVHETHELTVPYMRALSLCRRREGGVRPNQQEGVGEGQREAGGSVEKSEEVKEGRRAGGVEEAKLSKSHRHSYHCDHIGQNFQGEISVK
jgi:hypothetical protein